MKRVLFLHGFYASGACPMAEALREALRGDVELLTPDLPLHPRQALDEVLERCRRRQPDMLVGNSNGAFLALMAATQLQIPALLGNPHLQMSGFVRARVGTNRYKSPRADGRQEFTIEPTLADEFAELERQVWGHWTPAQRQLCEGLFGDRDTLAHYEPDIRAHFDRVSHFPGDHTPTPDETRRWYAPRVRAQLHIGE